MGFPRREDPPSIEVDAGHVGQDPAHFHADIFTPEVFAKLLAKLGMKWCPQHQDFEEIAGGSSATRSESYAGMRTGESTPDSSPPGI